MCLCQKSEELPSDQERGLRSDRAAISCIWLNLRRVFEFNQCMRWEQLLQFPLPTDWTEGSSQKLQRQQTHTHFHKIKQTQTPIKARVHTYTTTVQLYLHNISYISSLCFNFTFFTVSPCILVNSHHR